VISDQYKNQLNDLHKRKKFVSGLLKYSEVERFIKNYQPSSLLDFGCSSGLLIEKIKTNYPHITTIDGYDPAVDEFSILPKSPYDCLISNDVIEHIEPEFLENTLCIMDNLFQRYAWIVIACYPAKKLLPDGRNAHLTVESPNWWIDKIKKCFAKSIIVTQQIEEVAQNSDKNRTSEPKLELRVVLGKKVLF
jgi:hypothetical protein